MALKFRARAARVERERSGLRMMSDKYGRVQSGRAGWPFWFIAALAVAFVFFGFLTYGPTPAQALPSYARQTGQPCGTCHTDFAGLTPFGRRFKIGGYTYGGGQYRTTLFPSPEDDNSTKKGWVPPISMMAIVGFTDTQQV